MTDGLRVLIYSASTVVRLCLSAALADGANGRYRTSVAARMPDPAEPVPRLVGARRPEADVAVIHDPGLASRSATVSQAVPVPVVVAVGEGEADGAALSRVLRAGIPRIVSIGSDLDSLPRVCHLAGLGTGYLSPELVRVLADHLMGASTDAYAKYHFTAREIQVLRLLTDGRGVSEIAGRLRIKPRTVKYSLSNVYRKLGVEGAAEAIARAYRDGLVA